MNQKYKDNQINLINEYLEVDCICDNKNYESKNKIIKCFLCNKYQHLSCIYQAKFIKPYICFNCQFKNNHFYLKWKKTILPAKEIIYSNKWIKDEALLSKGTKKFTFYLNLNELYELNKEKNNKNENNSHYLAFLWMTNNGKPFHFGFPDNISIKINNNEFYSTDNKGFKYPLLLSLDDSYDYSPKKKHLITHDNFEILTAGDFFYPPKIINYRKKSSLQKVTISFDNPLENYYGSEFQFEEIRRYLFYIGVFQEIKTPQLSILKNTNKLTQYNEIFKYLYKEKVLKMKWNKISKNFLTSDNEEINMNFISNISNQKIIHPIRGLFCQHADVLDFGECCRYISSKNQIYKCYKCNKPLNVMYIDDISEKIFNEYKNKNYSEIYLNNKFKFIRGEKYDLYSNNLLLNENKTKQKQKQKQINLGKKIINDESSSEDEKENEEDDDEDDYLNDSFFKYHQNNFVINDNKNKNRNNLKKKLIKINNNNDDDIIDMISDDDNSENKINNDNDNVIEISETISLSSDSEVSCFDNYLNIQYISKENNDNDIDIDNNKINCLIPKKNNIQLSNKENKQKEKENNNSINEIENNEKAKENEDKNNIENCSSKEKNNNQKLLEDNKLLQKKRKTPKIDLGKKITKKNKNNKSNLISNQLYIKRNNKKISNANTNTKDKKTQNKKTNTSNNNNNNDEEIIEINQSRSNSNSSSFLPINEEKYIINEAYSIQQISTNSNDEKSDNNKSNKDYNYFGKNKKKIKLNIYSKNDN